MSFLNQITTGGAQVGQRIVISGVEKVGKTTLACGSPNSLLIPLEAGYGTIKTNRLEHTLTTWAEVEALCLELIAAAKAGKIQRGTSLVWDTATALERIIHTETLNRDTPAQKTKLGKTHSMETAHEGYGKAYPIANGLFETWSGYMDELALYGGINIIVTCHVFAAHIIDPAHGEYDTWDLLLHSPKNQKSYGKREFITQWADLIGFLHEPIIVMQAKEGDKLSRGISSNQGRVLAVDRSPGWVAGNRFNMHGSIAIPAFDDPIEQAINGWNALAQAIYKASGVDVFNRDVAPTKGA